MPVRRLGPRRFRWGTTGKIYTTRTAAERQGRAIQMARKPKKRGGRRGGR
jgi:hypothetical protein